jgi:hypothetical protein
MAIRGDRDSGAGWGRAVTAPRRHTTFVGRRPAGVVELYLVSDRDVRRIEAESGEGQVVPDWCGSAPSLLALSRLLLASASAEPLSPALESRFALSVLSWLPDDGFVLDADSVRDWIRRANGRYATVPTSRRPWRLRLAQLIRGTVTVPDGGGDRAPSHRR